MKHMEQEVSDLISLSNSGPESKEHLEGSEFFTRQPRKPSSTLSENSSYDNKLSKPNLKDIQLVPINKVPGKSWIWINEESGLQSCGHLMESMDTSTKGASLIEFLAEFDPNYQLPSEKLCRKLLTDAFVSFKETLKNILNDNVITCSLICDLWTGRNYMGYLGVTCSFINNNFQLNKLVLIIRYLPYPHTEESIAEALNVVINEWGLTNKIFTITTDNGSNMGLINAEVLIARAKRLMLFFTMPKQTERLINAQKNVHRAFELLKAEYEKAQILYRIEENNNSVQNHSNSLLASMFHKRCLQLEVSDYLEAQELS
ncbi:6932_t:CDS:2 [Cetraspora pellucida]|uniref:6932_t:CDS:1 n=1 Tax=Cetraspora pellucida TaxID=1433469 RepID=A0ACA9L7S3_9GLOM|nr:6932_t:CDS:2 [Cetraspora pellucida]